MSTPDTAAVPPTPSVESNWKLCPTCGVAIAGLHICPKNGGATITGALTDKTYSPSSTITAPPTPTSVEEARKVLMTTIVRLFSGDSMTYGELNAQLDPLIAAVRSSTLREVREMVAQLEWSGPVSGVGCTVKTADVLAGLAKMEGQ